MKQIEKAEFEELMNSTGKNIIVNFFKDNASPCKVMVPVLKQVEKECGKEIEFYQVDIEKEAMLALDYRILSVPTLLFIKDGVVKGKIEEAVTKSVIDTKIAKYFA